MILPLILSTLLFVALPHFSLSVHAPSSGSVQRPVSSSTVADAGPQTRALTVSRSTPMAPAPSEPATVGNGNDWAIHSSGTIASVKGSFPSVSGVTSESDSVEGDDVWSLQINTNRFSCNTLFTDNNPALCWEQFVFTQPSCSSVFCVPSDGNVFIEYWLIGYFATYGTCPSTDIPGDGGISDTNDWRQDQATGNSCLVDTDHTDTNTEHITSLSQFSLKGEIGSGQDCVTFTSPLEQDSPWSRCEDDSVLGLSQSWTDVEFNVFGFANSSQASFNTGTSITVEVDAIQQGTNPQFTCPSPPTGFKGWTGETNNLNRVGGCNAVPATAPYNGAISFRESTFQFSIQPPSNPLSFVMLNGGTITFQVGTLFLLSGPADSVTLSVVPPAGFLCAATFPSTPVTPTAAGAAISLTIQLPVPTNSNCLGDLPTISISANDGPLSHPAAPTNLHIYDFTVTAPSNMQVLTTGSNMFTITVALTPGSSTIGLPMVGLTLTGLPSGATSGFSPNIGLPGFTSTLTITALNAQSGTYPLTITATDSHTPGGGTRTSSPSLTVLTPAQALLTVINQLNGFQTAGTLTMGQATSLKFKLDAAISSLSLNNPHTVTACNQLNAFVNEVNSLVADSVLTPAQANQLLGGGLGVYAIMAAIPC